MPPVSTHRGPCAPCERPLCPLCTLGAPPCRQLNRDMFYTGVRVVGVILEAVVFATLFQGQGSGFSTFTQVLNVACSM